MVAAGLFCVSRYNYLSVPRKSGRPFVARPKQRPTQDSEGPTLVFDVLGQQPSPLRVINGTRLGSVVLDLRWRPNSPNRLAKDETGAAIGEIDNPKCISPTLVGYISG